MYICRLYSINTDNTVLALAVLVLHCLTVSHIYATKQITLLYSVHWFYTVSQKKHVTLFI